MLEVDTSAVIESGSQPGETNVPADRKLSYTQIAADLTARIAAGDFDPDDPIPSYAKLSAEYDVSVATIARTIAILRDRGVVRGEPGRGVYIA